MEENDTTVESTTEESGSVVFGKIASIVVGVAVGYAYLGIRDKIKARRVEHRVQETLEALEAWRLTQPIDTTSEEK